VSKVFRVVACYRAREGGAEKNDNTEGSLTGNKGISREKEICPRSVRKRTDIMRLHTRGRGARALENQCEKDENSVQGYGKRTRGGSRKEGGTVFINTKMKNGGTLLRTRSMKSPAWGEKEEKVGRVHPSCARVEVYDFLRARGPSKGFCERGGKSGRTRGVKKSLAKRDVA